MNAPPPPHPTPQQPGGPHPCLAHLPLWGRSLRLLCQILVTSLPLLGRGRGRAVGEGEGSGLQMGFPEPQPVIRNPPEVTLTQPVKLQGCLSWPRQGSPASPDPTHGLPPTPLPPLHESLFSPLGRLTPFSRVWRQDSGAHFCPPHVYGMAQTPAPL